MSSRITGATISCRGTPALAASRRFSIEDVSRESPIIISLRATSWASATDDLTQGVVSTLPTKTHCERQERRNLTSILKTRTCKGLWRRYYFVPLYGFLPLYGYYHSGTNTYYLLEMWTSFVAWCRPLRLGERCPPHWSGKSGEAREPQGWWHPPTQY